MSIKFNSTVILETLDNRGDGAVMTPERQNDQIEADLVARLYKDAYSDLFLFLLKRLADRQDAHDLAQEAYLRLLRVDRFDLVEQPKAYLFRVATNLVYEFRIKQGKNVLHHAGLLDDMGVPAPDETPERHYELRQSIEHVADILDSLPPLYEAVLLMRKRDGLSQPEIAEKLGVSIHTVRKYLTRAIVACRKACEEDETR